MCYVVLFWGLGLVIWYLLCLEGFPPNSAKFVMAQEEEKDAEQSVNTEIRSERLFALGAIMRSSGRQVFNSGRVIVSSCHLVRWATVNGR